MEAISALVERFRVEGMQMFKEALKFGAVGLMALVIDVGIFNLLMFLGGDGALHDKPLTAKTLSAIVATFFAYFANRYWSFNERDHISTGKGIVLFFVFNAVATGIALICLWFSHYIMQLNTPLADNISANFIGLALGTLFRFYSYRRWVFPSNSK